jgi:hypothetical protein
MRGELFFCDFKLAVEDFSPVSNVELLVRLEENVDQPHMDRSY